VGLLILISAALVFSKQLNFRLIPSVSAYVGDNLYLDDFALSGAPLVTSSPAELMTV
jgi:hypothetical protein